MLDEAMRRHIRNVKRHGWTGHLCCVSFCGRQSDPEAPCFCPHQPMESLKAEALTYLERGDFKTALQYVFLAATKLRYNQ